MLDDAKETIHGVVVAVANHQKFRVLLNTGTENWFVSSISINHIYQKPVYWESMEMEIIAMTITKNLPTYKVQLHSTDGKYSIDIIVNKLDRPDLTTLNNPRISGNIHIYLEYNLTMKTKRIKTLSTSY